MEVPAKTVLRKFHLIKLFRQMGRSAAKTRLLQFCHPSSARHILPAIHRHCCAVDKGSFIAGEIGHHTGDLFGTPETPRRDAGNNAVQNFRLHGGQHFSVDVTWRDTVGGDALLGALLSKRFCKTDQSGFCR